MGGRRAGVRCYWCPAALFGLPTWTQVVPRVSWGTIGLVSSRAFQWYRFRTLGTMLCHGWSWHHKWGCTQMLFRLAVVAGFGKNKRGVNRGVNQRTFQVKRRGAGTSGTASSRATARPHLRTRRARRRCPRLGSRRTTRRRTRARGPLARARRRPTRTTSHSGAPAIRARWPPGCTTC